MTIFAFLLLFMTLFMICSGSVHIQKLSIKNLNGSKLKRIACLRGGAVHANNLPMNQFAVVLATLISPSVSGGLLSGGLHAISGPDHLAALIPSSIGRPALNGIRIGAIWGLGHGLSAIALGLSAFFMKGRLAGKFQVLSRFADLAESAVGFSLLLIGVMGVLECRDTSVILVSGGGADDGGRGVEDTVSTGGSGKRMQKIVSMKVLFLNGLVHGLSLDGAPSLAPAMTMTSWREASQFLLSYSLGTMIAMSIVAGGVGELSMRIGQVADNPNLSRQLSFASSIAAVLIGLYWIVKNLLLKGLLR